MACRFTYRSWT